MICKPGDIVVLPFPFTDKNSTKRRPALVISSQKFNDDNNQSVFAMITTAKQSSWISDTPIKNSETTGLTANSVVRMKLFTLENQFIFRQIGHLSSDDHLAVSAELKKIITI